MLLCSLVRPKYKQWLLEYVDAWVERTKMNDGIIPTNIGLDGSIGGTAEGKWYGSVYGWGFTVEVPQSGALAHRNRVGRGQIGFNNAFLLTGDRRYIDTWSAMIDKVNSNSREVDGMTVYPRMYGDTGWYAFEPSPWATGALDCYFFTCDPKDRSRLPNDMWIAFLDGNNPEYPEQALRQDFERIRAKNAAMRQDKTTADTRLADDPMKYNPATVRSLRQLMMAGLDPGRDGALLHCRLRYFDPIKRRAGLPPHVAALIDKMTADQVAVTLVNLHQTQAQELIVQTGAYAEHQCLFVQIKDHRIPIDSPNFTMHLAPGAGGRLVVHTKRYANQPTLAHPWDQRPTVKIK